MLLASFVNAMAANIFDYDDTHPNTIIHPTAPVAPALFAYAQAEGCDGAALLRAFIIGGEIECRLGNAVSPYHYGRGWHITSTCGVFGAAVGVGALLGLREEQFGWALGNASAQASGLVETLGTMSKSISVGNAARNGLSSALLRSRIFRAPWLRWKASAVSCRFMRMTRKSMRCWAGWERNGRSRRIRTNPIRPGSCSTPVMEACIDLHRAGGIRIEDVAEVELTGHPFLQQRADRPDVATGRESQVSAQHAIAIALRRGRAGLAEFSDDAVAETARDGIRPTVRFIDDTRYDIEGVKVVLRMKQGAEHIVEITDTRGGSVNPMTDADLNDKLAMLAEYGGFDQDVTALADALWSLDTAGDAGNIMALCTRQ